MFCHRIYPAVAAPPLALRSLLAAAVLALGQVCLVEAWAAEPRPAEPALPPTATSHEVVWLTRLDLTTLKADDVRAALHATLGHDASDLHGLVEVIDGKLRGLADQGVQVVLIARCYGSADDELPVREYTVLRFVAGVDQKQLGEQIIKSMYGADFSELFTARWDGNWLTISGTDEQPNVDEKPTKRAARFEAAYQALGKRPGMIFVPNDRARELDREGRAAAPQPKDVPASAGAVNEALLNCQWAALAVKLGKQPGLQFTAEMPDEAKAKKLLADFQRLQQDLQKTPVAGAGDLALTLAGTIKTAPGQKGAQVSLLLDAPAAQPWVAQMVLAPLRRSQQAGAASQVIHSLKELVLAIQQYEQKKGELPATLDDLKAFLVDTEAMDADEFKQVLTNVKTGESPGFVYTRPAKHSRDIKQRSSKTVVLEELKDGKPDPDGYRAYLDGSVDSKQHPKDEDE